MTRHNLNSHISWLLSHKVTPPSGVHASALINPTTAEPVHASFLEEGAEEDISRALPSPPQHSRAAQLVDVVQAFARPALPASLTAQSHLQNSRQTLTDESMGKLTSASRSARPTLMSQHQLATPASTTYSTATPSLTSTYTQFLKSNEDHGKFQRRSHQH